MADTTGRLDRIAWNIVKSMHARKKASVIHVPTEDGVEAVEIRNVRIIIEKIPPKIKSKIFAGRTTRTSGIYDFRNKKPFYPKQELIRLLSEKPARIKFDDRIDNLADPEKQGMGISREQAAEIIKELDPRHIFKGGNFRETLTRMNPPVDVYSKYFQTEEGGEIELYIKFYIADHTLVVVVSFHESIQI